MIRRSICLVFAMAFTVLASPSAFAQGSTDDATLMPAEPDFTVIALPTSLRLPVMKGEIRITHRFVRPLKCDTCPSSLAGDGFGIDDGALIGLEYRMGIIPNGQVIVHRARTNKTVEFLGEWPEEGIFSLGNATADDDGLGIENVDEGHACAG